MEGEFLESSNLIAARKPALLYFLERFKRFTDFRESLSNWGDGKPIRGIYSHSVSVWVEEVERCNRAIHLPQQSEDTNFCED